MTLVKLNDKLIEFYSMERLKVDHWFSMWWRDHGGEYVDSQANIASRVT